MPRGKRKKVYQFTLNQESVEVVRAWLKANTGQTLSGYLTSILDDLALNIQGQPTPLSKNPNEMTLKEFTHAIQYWLQKSQEAEANADEG